MLDIIYHDDSIVIINKDAGLLSVPGRGTDKSDSAATRIRTIFPRCIKQPSVHRLDMDTSGLLIFALTPEAHRNLSIQFQNSVVRKEYEAVLEGLLPDYLGNDGRIVLRFRLDPENRPRQIFDPLLGKEGITLWEKFSVESYRTRICFRPLTGRTHQLRLHSAHPSSTDGSGGLGCPIVGDRLYGNSCDEDHEAGDRMLLHASMIEFCHPDSGERMIFRNPAPF